MPLPYIEGGWGMATIRSKRFLPQQLLTVEVDNWLKLLGEIVDKYGGETIKEVDSLLVKLVGDFAGGMVLKKILAWLSTVDRDYIWKSDKEWDAELGLSYDQMRRIRENVLSPVVLTYQKSARNRTMHYKLNNLQFMLKLSDVLGVGLLKIQGMFGKAKNASSGKPRMQTGDSQETLTKKPTNSSKQKNKKQVVVSHDDSLVENESVQLLVAQGYSKTDAEKYQALDAAIVAECISDAQIKERDKKIKKTFKAYLTGALNIQLGEQVKRAETAAAYGGQFETSSEEIEMSTPSWARDVSVDDPEWWKAVQVQLEYQLPQSIWMYIRNIEFVSDDDEVVLHVPDTCSMHVAQRYSRNIERLVTMARGASVIQYEGVA